MQWSRNIVAQSLVAAQYGDTFENEYISKILIQIAGAAGTDGPTRAELEAMTLYTRWIVEGKETVLDETNLLDLAFLTDILGGYAGSFASGATKWPLINIVRNYGLDLNGPNRHLEFRLQVPATIANTTISIWGLNDGSRPATLRYQTLASANEMAFENVMKLYTRNEANTSGNIKIGNDKLKTIDWAMGRVALQEWASIEASSLYGQLVSSEVPTSVTIRPGAAITALMVGTP